MRRATLLLLLMAAIRPLSSQVSVAVCTQVIQPPSNPYPPPEPLFTCPALAQQLRQSETQVVATNGQLQSEIKRVNARVDSIGRALHAQLDKDEIALGDRVVASVQALPQGLLSKEAQDAIKAAIIAELREELRSVRHDLQTQIDDLKKVPPR